LESTSKTFLESVPLRQSKRNCKIFKENSTKEKRKLRLFWHQIQGLKEAKTQSRGDS